MTNNNQGPNMANQYVQCPHCGRMEQKDGVHTCVGDNRHPAPPPATGKDSLQVAAPEDDHQPETSK